jgi:hypothetical protein
MERMKRRAATLLRHPDCACRKQKQPGQSLQRHSRAKRRSYCGDAEE